MFWNVLLHTNGSGVCSMLAVAMTQTLISIFKQPCGHLMQIDGYMDVSYRKLCRLIVGPPPGTNWNLEWHEIIHRWNERVEHFAALAGVKSWSQCVFFLIRKVCGAPPFTQMG